MFWLAEEQQEGKIYFRHVYYKYNLYLFHDVTTFSILYWESSTDYLKIYHSYIEKINWSLLNVIYTHYDFWNTSDNNRFTTNIITVVTCVAVTDCTQLISLSAIESQTVKYSYPIRTVVKINNRSLYSVRWYNNGYARWCTTKIEHILYAFLILYGNFMVNVNNQYN